MSKKDTIKNAFDYDGRRIDAWWAGLNDEEREMIKERIKEYDQTIELNKKQKEKDIKNNLNLYVTDIKLKRSKRYILAKSEEDIIRRFNELSETIISDLVDEDYIDGESFKIGNIEKVREKDPILRKLLLEDLIDRRPFLVSDDDKEIYRISKASHEELCDCLIDAMDNSIKNDDSVDEKSKIKVEYDLEVDKQGEYVVNMKYKSDEENEK